MFVISFDVTLSDLNDQLDRLIVVSNTTTREGWSVFNIAICQSTQMNVFDSPK